MTILGIIPSRYNSTRFPGKPLAIINGKSMIQRVYEQASKSKALKKVVVATDDDQIFKHVKEFGGEVVMTSAEHQNGTERCAEALSLLGSYDAVINIQGDEPFIRPEQIDLVAQCLNEGADIATLVKRITDIADLENTSVVKVIVDSIDSKALNFNRKMRHPEAGRGKSLVDSGACYKHIGIYGYKASVLQTIVKLPLNPIEKSESLEQLRWLQNGCKIKVKETSHETQAIDTPEDLERILESSRFEV